MKYTRVEVRRIRNDAEDHPNAPNARVVIDLCNQLLEWLESEVEVGEDDDGVE